MSVDHRPARRGTRPGASPGATESGSDRSSCRAHLRGERGGGLAVDLVTEQRSPFSGCETLEGRSDGLGLLPPNNTLIGCRRLAGIEQTVLEASTVGSPAPVRRDQVAGHHDPVGTERPFVQPAPRRQEPGEGLLHDVVHRVGVADSGRDDASDQCGQLGDVHPIPTRTFDVPQHPRDLKLPPSAGAQASPMRDYRRRGVMCRRSSVSTGERSGRRGRRKNVHHRQPKDRSCLHPSCPSSPPSPAPPGVGLTADRSGPRSSHPPVTAGFRRLDAARWGGGRLTARRSPPARHAP